MYVCMYTYLYIYICIYVRICMYLNKNTHIAIYVYIAESETAILNIWYPQLVRVARFSSTQQQSDLHQHSTLIGKMHLPFLNQPSHLLFQSSFFVSSSASHSSIDLQPRNVLPITIHDHPLSSTHDHTNEHCLP